MTSSTAQHCVILGGSSDIIQSYRFSCSLLHKQDVDKCIEDYYWPVLFQLILYNHVHLTPPEFHAVHCTPPHQIWKCLLLAGRKKWQYFKKDSIFRFLLHPSTTDVYLTLNSDGLICLRTSCRPPHSSGFSSFLSLSNWKRKYQFWSQQFVRFWKLF